MEHQLIRMEAAKRDARPHRSGIAASQVLLLHEIIPTPALQPERDTLKRCGVEPVQRSSDLVGGPGPYVTEVMQRLSAQRQNRRR